MVESNPQVSAKPHIKFSRDFGHVRESKAVDDSGQWTISKSAKRMTQDFKLDLTSTSIYQNAVG